MNSLRTTVVLFQYAPDYHGPAISISLPVAQRQFPSEMLHPYFASLAPEGWLRQRYSQIQHRDENDLLGMLIDNGKNLLGPSRFYLGRNNGELSYSVNAVE